MGGRRGQAQQRSKKVCQGLVLAAQRALGDAQTTAAVHDTMTVKSTQGKTQEAAVGRDFHSTGQGKPGVGDSGRKIGEGKTAVRWKVTGQNATCPIPTIVDWLLNAECGCLAAMPMTSYQ